MEEIVFLVLMERVLIARGKKSYQLIVHFDKIYCGMKFPQTRTKCLTPAQQSRINNLLKEMFPDEVCENMRSFTKYL